MGTEQDPFANPRPPLAERMAAIEGKLYTDIPWNVLRRFGQPAMTYGQLIGSEPFGESLHLPYGAKRWSDPEAIVTLQELHLAQIDRYLATSLITPYSDLLHRAGYNSYENVPSATHTEATGEARNWVYEQFVEWLHPEINGRDWHRGHVVPLDTGDRLYLAEPFMEIMERGAPFPLLFSLGSPQIGQVREFAYRFLEEGRRAAG